MLCHLKEAKHEIEMWGFPHFGFDIKNLAQASGAALCPPTPPPATAQEGTFHFCFINYLLLSLLESFVQLHVGTPRPWKHHRSHPATLFQSHNEDHLRLLENLKNLLSMSLAQNQREKPAGPCFKCKETGCWVSDCTRPPGHCGQCVKQAKIPALESQLLQLQNGEPPPRLLVSQGEETKHWRGLGRSSVPLSREVVRTTEEPQEALRVNHRRFMWWRKKY